MAKLMKDRKSPPPPGIPSTGSFNRRNGGDPVPVLVKKVNKYDDVSPGQEMFDITMAIATYGKSPSVALLLGEAGVGKTHAALELSRRWKNPDGTSSKFIDVQFNPNTGTEILYTISGPNMVEAISPRGTGTGSEAFILSPLVKAAELSLTQKVVLLLDEIDKAPYDVLYYLFSLFSEGKFNDITLLNMNKGESFNLNPKNIIIVCTSNGTKEIPEAMNRRMVQFYMEFPSKAKLNHIIKTMIKREIDIDPTDSLVFFLSSALITYRGIEKIKKSLVQNEIVRIVTFLYGMKQQGVPRKGLERHVKTMFSPHEKDIQLAFNSRSTKGLNLTHFISSVWKELPGA